jgi:hypothetical protein
MQTEQIFADFFAGEFLAEFKKFSQNAEEFLADFLKNFSLNAEEFLADYAD